MHAKASVDGTTIAETDHYEFVEGNVYFPPDSIKNMSEFLTQSSQTSSCPWKGMGHYYNINVPGKTLENAAWYYPEPLEKAEYIKNYVAFYKGKVEVEYDGGDDSKHHGFMDKVKGMMK